MVPKGWVLGCVGDLLIGLESGVSVNGEDRHAQPGEKSVLKVSAVSYGWFDSKASKVIDKNEISRAKTKPRAGQIIVSRSNTESFVGASAYVDKDYQDIFLPDKLWQTVPKPDANMKWLSYVLASEHVRYTLSKLATGTSGSMKNITKGEFLTLKILIPPLPEQRKIAQTLSIWEEAIATTQQLLINSKQQKKSLMQKILTGRDRFSKFTEKWKSYELSDIAMVRMGSSPKSGAYNEDGYGLPLIQGNADIKNRRSAPRIFTTEITKECDVGDILLSVRAPVGTVALSSHKACIGRGISAIRARLGFSQDFLYQWFLWFEPRWGALSQGSTFDSINSNDIKQLKIKLPSLDEQKEIASILSSADQEIELLQQKLNHLKQEQKALMQQLLTGKRRVKVDAA